MKPFISSKFRNKPLSISYLLCLSAIAAFSGNAEEIVELPVLEITGSRSFYLKEAIPLSHQFISADEIGDANPAGMEDLLSNTPGIHVDRTSRSGGISSIYLRGGDPNFTLTLVNGVKLNDPTNDRGGSYDYSSIDPFGLQGVEILKGAQSALYGSEALSGVVNLITIDEAPLSGRSLMGEIGTDDFRQARFVANESKGAFFGRVTASYLDVGSAVEGESLKSRRYSASSLIAINEQSKLRVFGLASNTDKTSFPQDSGGPQFAVIRELDVRSIEDQAIGLSYMLEAKENARFQFDASLYHRNESIDSPGVAPGLRDPFGIPPTLSDNELDRYQFGAHGEFFSGDDASLIIGAGWEAEDSSVDYSLIFPWQTISDLAILDRETQSAFAEFDWKPNARLTWQIGARYDDPDGIDAETSLLSGISYEFPDKNSYARIHYAEGFKKPSVFALTNPVVGNPDLLPEDSQSLELAWGTRFDDGKASLEIALFDQSFENLVDFDSGPPPMMVNRGHVESKGGEIVGKYEISDTLEINGYLSYADAEIVDSLEILEHRPQWRGAATAQWQANEKTMLSLTGTFVDRRHDSSIATGDKRLGAFLRADLRVKYEINDALAAWLAIDNVLDDDYQETIGFPNPGRQARLAIGWSD